MRPRNFHEEERAPHGRELLHQPCGDPFSPAEPLPLAIDKWKLNTSPGGFRIIVSSPRVMQSVQKFKIQEALARGIS